MKAMRAKKTNKSVKPYEKGAFNIFNTIGMCIIMLVTIYPMWYALINSLNSGDALTKGYSFFLPEKFTLASWKLVLGDAEIINALWITGSRTIIVTIGSTLITAMVFPDNIYMEGSFLQDLVLSACILVVVRLQPSFL